MKMRQKGSKEWVDILWSSPPHSESDIREAVEEFCEMYGVSHGIVEVYRKGKYEVNQYMYPAWDVTKVK